MGDQGFYWFFGQVTSTQDPLQNGRVQIRIYTLHDEIQTSELPWAIPISPIQSASSGGIGHSPTGISIGSVVFGFFADGHEKNVPFILGGFHGIPMVNGNPVNDVSPLALGQNSIQNNQVGPEPPSAYAATYPNNKTITTNSGHAIEMDDTPGQERIRLYHKAGAYIEINSQGRFVIKSPNDGFDITAQNKIIYVGGDCTINVEGTANVTASTLNIFGDNGDCIIDLISLVNHVHTNVEPGPGNSGPPLK